ncbi:Fic family protein [Halobacteria archaeon HArc-gm2]|nr:Fic family protein [Halobacteria archaeon HArc-gm2]
MSDEFTLPDSAPGRYIPLREDAPHHRAYYPDNLPPSIELTDEIVDELTRAMHSLGRLDGVTSEVENATTVFSSFLYKEAEQSSQVEGTAVTVSDIIESELTDGAPAGSTDPSEKDIQEARNYIRAVKEGLGYLQTAGRSRSNITTELVKSLHETLMETGRTDEDDPLQGEFRPDLAYIKEDTEPWKDPVRFVPPKPDMARARMADLESYIQSDGQYPDLIDIALTHYQFETIHPFRDGNGRVGRLLVVLLLYCADILVNPILYLSSYINQRRDTYADLLLHVSERGAWKEWIQFFLTGLRKQADEGFVRAKLLLRKRREYRETYDEAATSTARLAQALFSKPYISIREAADLIDMSYESGRKAVDVLVDDGVLVPHTERKWGRLYRADEILDIVERSETALPEPADLIDNDVTGRLSI